MSERSCPRQVPALARAALVPAFVVFVVQLALAHRYGWHRDELYFVACSRHLAWGYVDQPPFTPFVAWLSREVVGTSLVGLRLIPAMANAAVVVLTAVIARELGARSTVQVLAATAAAVSSVILGMGHLLSTAIFDAAAWAAISAIVVHVWRTRNPRWWIAAGAVAGIGLENKYTVLFLLGAIGLGIAISRRDDLREPWLWAGAGIALVIWLPNLLWQAHHGWPVVDMSRSLRDKGVRDGNRFLFLPLQFVFLNPVVTPLWIAGLVWSARRRAYRPFAVAWVVLTVAFIASAGKAYYLVGLYPFLLAAGAVWFAERWSVVALRRYAAVVAAAAVLAAPLGLPVLPISAAGGGVVAAANAEFRESYGWHDFVDTVEKVPGQVVFTQNYGEAGALEAFAPRRPVYSGHNNYWLWGPPPDDAQPVVVVGHVSRSFLSRNFRDCRRDATVDNPEHVSNEERGAGVWSCAGAKRPWHEEWRALRHYNA